MTTMTTMTADWIVVRAISNYRVWNTETHQYHHGSDKAVRVYRDSQAAQRRADILNGRISADESAH